MRRCYPNGRKSFDNSTFTTFAVLEEIEKHQLNNIVSLNDLKEKLNTFTK